MRKKIILVTTIIVALFMCSWLTNMGNLFSNFNKLPESVKMYFYIEKYSDKYEIPKNIAYGVPHYETGYNGIQDTAYDPKQTSDHKAYGAMQIKLPTARLVIGKSITKKELINNTELNVEISFKLLHSLYLKYGNWQKALGAYNTGRPVCNNYAKKIIKFKFKNIKKDGDEFIKN